MNLTNAKIDVNAADNQGNTALHVAAQRSLLSVVSALLAAGANPCAKNSQENTPIHQVVSRPQATSDVERDLTRKTLVALLVAFGDENLLSGLPVNKQLDSILVKAVHQGNFDGARTIIEHLMAMAKKGKISAEKLKVLLNCRNNRGFTPLHEACIWGKTEILRYLMDCNLDNVPLFDVTEVDNAGNTLLHMAGDRRLTGISTGPLDHVELLLGNGKLSVNTQNSAGETPLHIPHISVEFLDLLLSHGADPSLKNNAGDSTLSVQIRSGRAHVVERLLRHLVGGGDLAPYKHALVSDRDSNGNTAAHLLASIDSELFGNLPHELHNVQNKNGEKPLHIAIEEKAINVLMVLMKNKALSEEEIEALRQWRDSYGNSLLHQAAQTDNAEAALTLLESAHFDANIANQEMDEFTDGGAPIHVAALAGSTNTILVLLKHGAAVNSQQNPTLDTPLHLAIRFNKAEAVKTLLENGATKDIPNRDGQTAMQEMRSLRGLDEHIRSLLNPEE